MKVFTIYLDGKPVKQFKTLKTAKKYASIYDKSLLYRSIVITEKRIFNPIKL